jgi:negative regulator of sigma E activity
MTTFELRLRGDHAIEQARIREQRKSWSPVLHHLSVAANVTLAVALGLLAVLGFAIIVSASR